MNTRTLSAEEQRQVEQILKSKSNFKPEYWISSTEIFKGIECRSKYEPTPKKEKVAREYYCDCKELNILNGITNKRLMDSADSDEAFGIFKTTLNNSGFCKHCGYLPLLQPHRDIDHLGLLGDVLDKNTQLKRDWWF